MNTKTLEILYKKKYAELPDVIESLQASGSHRKYYRIHNAGRSCIGVYNEDIRENKAFLNFTESFRKNGLRVPEIYAVSEDLQHYLLQDLGNVHLKDIIDNSETPVSGNEKVIGLYMEALSELVKFQVFGKDSIDFSYCIPRNRFDYQSMLWDLNHFKYFFLKLTGIPFDEQKLEDDFQTLVKKLYDSEDEYFLYRDFQSRNIMIYNNSCYFIDFQGGRKGALQYDVASILFEARTNIPPELRHRLLDHYLDSLGAFIPLDVKKFNEKYYGFVLIRILQAMGAYGLRGWIEKKALFLQSLPFALNNLGWLLNEKKINGDIPELSRLIEKFISDPRLKIHHGKTIDKLRIEINSFSYRKTLPDDYSGNGGGFIFDCRAIHNPGKYPELKGYTGLDPEIDLFFKANSEMSSFIDEVFRVISRSISSYEKLGYKNLQVNFGCTGGKHRSVYAAERITEKIKDTFDVFVELHHRELERMK